MKIGANVGHPRRWIGNARGPSSKLVTVTVVVPLEDAELLKVPLTKGIPIRRMGSTLVSNERLGAAFNWHLSSRVSSYQARSDPQTNLVCIDGSRLLWW
jgi:hypothetical protein